MEAIQKYLLWIVVGLVVLGSAAIQLLVVDGIRADAEQLRLNCEGGLASLKRITKDAKSIKNKKYVAAAKAFKTHLDDQESLVKSTLGLEGKGLLLRGRFASVPQEEIVFTDTWLPEVWKDTLTVAEKSRMALPGGHEGFKKSHMYAEDDLSSKEQIPERTVRLAIIYEIVKSLANGKAQVTRYKWVPDLKDRNQKKSSVSVGVLSLDYLVIHDETKQAERKKSELEAMYKSAGVTAPRKRSKDKLHQSRRVEVVFTAYLPMVTQALHALETNGNYCGIIRTIDSQRTASSFPNKDDFNRILPRDPTSHPGRVNSYFQEAPVQIFVVMDLMEINQKVLEEKMKKTAPPPKRRTAKKKPKRKKPKR